MNKAGGSRGMDGNKEHGGTWKHGITDVSVLALDRFRLCDELEERIQEHRNSERTAAFEEWLLPESALTVSDAATLNFKTKPYEPSWLYEGGFQFKKHYFGPKPGELREKRADGEQTEEFKCAQCGDSRGSSRERRQPGTSPTPRTRGRRSCLHTRHAPHPGAPAALPRP